MRYTVWWLPMKEPLAQFDTYEKAEAEVRRRGRGSTVVPGCHI